MNLNTSQYLDDPSEFLHFIIHETVHVLYERSHAVPALRNVQTPGDWLDTFGLWLQNEGFAVFAPLRLRLERKQLKDRDYQVLLDPLKLSICLRIYHETHELLTSRQALDSEEMLELIFGSSRILYRAGCEIFRRIQEKDGLPAVRSAFYLSGSEFIARFGDIV